MLRLGPRFSCAVLLSSVLASWACGSDDPSAPATPSDGDAAMTEGGSSDGSSSIDGGIPESDASANDATTDAPLDVTDASSASDGSDASDAGDAQAEAGPVVTTTYATSIAAGSDMACVVQTSGEMKCWGATSAPTVVAAGTTWKQISVSGLATAARCAIKSDDTLWCSTLGAATAPAKIGTDTFKHVNAAGSNQCAVTTTGALHCWGTNNVFGQLGVGDTSPHGTYGTGTQVGSALDWKMVTGSGNHTCAIKDDGALHCWGYNGFGQLGDNTQTDSPSPVPIDSAHKYVDVDARYVGTCAVRDDGGLYCWGTSYTSVPQKTPTSMDGATNWKKVRLSTSHACALKTNGELHCWGSNSTGQLGLTPASGSLYFAAPTRVGTDSDWVDVGVGFGFTCATKQDGTVRCWGSNTAGQIARPQFAHLSPTLIGAPGEFASVGAGPNVTCAVRKNGTLACWGSSAALNSGAPAQTPLTFGAATSWKTVRPAETNVCATNSADALSCWGPLGSPIAMNLTVSAYDVASFHQCAIASSSLYCWGNGSFNKLGNGSNAIVALPAKVGSDTWKSVATGFDATCAVKTDGTLHCFGNGYTSIEKQGAATTWSSADTTTQANQFYGLQGTALYTWTGSSAPAASGSENDWTQIAAGRGHVCGIRSGGSLWCKGENGWGQLGDGTRDPSLASIVRVGTANDWTSVVAGSAFTCGLRGAGDLYCWGSNDFGEIGDDTSWRSAPQVVP